MRIFLPERAGIRDGIRLLSELFFFYNEGVRFWKNRTKGSLQNMGMEVIYGTIKDSDDKG